MPTKILLISALGLCSITGCKNKDEREETATSTSLIANEETSTSSVTTNLTDALEALSDSNISTGAASLTSLQSSVERVCTEADDGTVTVTIEKTIAKTLSRENNFRSVEQNIEGSDSIARKWSQTEQDLACNTGNKSAQIAFNEDITGLTLDVTTGKSREIERRVLIKARDITKEFNSQLQADGTRKISWLSHTTGQGGTIVRRKQIESNMNRSHQVTKANNENFSISFSLKTVIDKPLIVQVTRDGTNFDLTQKMIESGSLEGTESSGSRVISAFTNVTYNFEGDSCNLVSGTVESSFYQSGTEEPVKILKFEASNSVYTLKDITDSENPTEVENFDVPLCDPADFLES